MGEGDCACKPGDPPACLSPDPANCNSSCTETASGSQCVVSAHDVDIDGHGTRACTQAPGDDCEDNDKTIFPGATEVCDGKDNDCDGYEGANLNARAVQEIGSGISPSFGDASIAWHAPGDRFDIVYAANRDLLYARVDRQGTRVSNRSLASETSGVIDLPQVISAGTNAVVAWTRLGVTAGGQIDTQAGATIGTGTIPLVNQPMTVTSLVVAQVGTVQPIFDGTTARLLFWSQDQSKSAIYTSTPSISLVKEFAGRWNFDWAGASWHQHTVGVGANSLVEFGSLLSTSFVQLGALAELPFAPEIVSLGSPEDVTTPDGVFLGYSTFDGSKSIQVMTARTPQGAARCSVTLAGPQTAQTWDSWSLRYHPSGELLALFRARWQDDSQTLYLQRFDNMCVSKGLPILIAKIPPGRATLFPTFDLNAEAMAAVWNDPVANKLYLQSMSATLCGP